MKKKTLVSGFIFIIIAGTTLLVNSCAPSALIKAKTGAQLWGENCQRCHNVPPPNAFNDSQWEAIGRHMHLRANLTDDETTKVIEFLKTGN